MPIDRSDAMGSRMRNENRKSSKPAMERRRRQRINQSLSDLKTLILDSIKKTDPPRQASKLEKADILELTVRHLQGIQRSQAAIMTDEPVHMGAAKYRAGFGECIHATVRFLSQCDGVSEAALHGLITHLEEQITMPQHSSINPAFYSPAHQSPAGHPSQQGGLTSSLRAVRQTSPPPPLVPQTGFQVTPTRLPNNGRFGFLVDQQQYRQFGLPHSPTTGTEEDQFAAAAHGPLDFSLNLKFGPKMLRQSVSPDNSRSVCGSESENVWRPW